MPEITTNIVERQLIKDGYIKAYVASNEFNIKMSITQQGIIALKILNDVNDKRP